MNNAKSGERSDWLSISSVLWIHLPKLLLTGTAAVKQRTYGRQQHRAGKWLLQIDAVRNKGRSLPYAVLVLRSDEDRRRGHYGRGEMIE